jgi:hypothetical protein
MLTSRPRLLVVHGEVEADHDILLFAKGSDLGIGSLEGGSCEWKVSDMCLIITRREKRLPRPPDFDEVCKIAILKNRNP